MWLCSTDRQHLVFVLNPQACPADVFDASPRRKLDLADLTGQDIFRCYTGRATFFMAVYTHCAMLPGDWQEALAPLCAGNLDRNRSRWYGAVAWYAPQDDVFYMDTADRYGRKDEAERWYVDVRKRYTAPAPTQLSLI